jgi:hypothetical protein
MVGVVVCRSADSEVELEDEIWEEYFEILRIQQTLQTLAFSL